MATAPRRIIAGTTYLVTRRCSERRFFLRPSALTTHPAALVEGNPVALEGDEEDR